MPLLPARLSSVMAVLGWMLLAGCVNEPQLSAAVRYPIKVEAQPAVLNLGSGTLGDEAAVRLEAFARDWAVQGRGPLTLAVPQGEDHRPLVDAAIQQLLSMGVPATSIRKGSYPLGDNQHTGVVAFFDRPHAISPNCGERWSEPVYLLHNNGIPQLGCANQNNLAVMVATPSDLIKPRTTTQIDHEQRTNSLQNYRMGTLTANNEEQETSSTRATE